MSVDLLSHLLLWGCRICSVEGRGNTYEVEHVAALRNTMCIPTHFQSTCKSAWFTHIYLSSLVWITALNLGTGIKITFKHQEYINEPLGVHALDFKWNRGIKIHLLVSIYCIHAIIGRTDFKKIKYDVFLPSCFLKFIFTNLKCWVLGERVNESQSLRSVLL